MRGVRGRFLMEKNNCVPLYLCFYFIFSIPYGLNYVGIYFLISVVG